MPTKAQSKPARRKSPTSRKIAPRRPAAETAEASTIPTPSKRKSTEDSIAKLALASPATPASGIRPKPSSKLGIVLALLEKPQGATLAKLIEVTRWLPHTMRAALTGLRKRGFVVVCQKTEEGGRSVYRIRSEGA